MDSIIIANLELSLSGHFSHFLGQEKIEGASVTEVYEEGCGAGAEDDFSSGRGLSSPVCSTQFC